VGQVFKGGLLLSLLGKAKCLLSGTKLAEKNVIPDTSRTAQGCEYLESSTSIQDLTVRRQMERSNDFGEYLKMNACGFNTRQQHRVNFKLN